MEPTRLLHPWNSPGKNTGVSKPFLSLGDLPDPRLKPRSFAPQTDSLLPEPPGKPSTLSLSIYIYAYSHNDTIVVYSILKTN